MKRSLTILLNDRITFPDKFKANLPAGLEDKLVALRAKEAKQDTPSYEFRLLKYQQAFLS